MLALKLTGPTPKEIEFETFRINYLIRSPKVEKLGLEPVRKGRDMLMRGFSVCWHVGLSP